MNNCVKWETSSKEKVNYSGFAVDFLYNCNFKSIMILLFVSLNEFFVKSYYTGKKFWVEVKFSVFFFDVSIHRSTAVPVIASSIFANKESIKLY